MKGRDNQPASPDGHPACWPAAAFSAVLGWASGGGGVTLGNAQESSEGTRLQGCIMAGAW